jgi:hypothetical protein
MRHPSLLPAVMLTTMAILLTGCSRSPVAPSTELSAAPGAGAAAVIPIPDDPPPADGGTPAVRTQIFATAEGGSLTVGRWTLEIRKNSLRMPTTITMKVSDPEAMEVMIDVQPAAANNFQSPVILTANTSDVAGFDYSTGAQSIWVAGDWQTVSDYSSHQNQENVVGHFTSLTTTQVNNSGGKGKKIGA